MVSRVPLPSYENRLLFLALLLLQKGKFFPGNRILVSLVNKLYDC